MTSLINFCRMLFKRRKHQRFSVKTGSFVFVSFGTERERRFQIIDISMGGVAFVYPESPEELDSSGVLTLLADKPELSKVNFAMASDNPISQSSQTSEHYRRRGVEFKWMGVLEKVELKAFINKISIVGV